jgi:5'-3' exonuclease
MGRDTAKSDDREEDEEKAVIVFDSNYICHVAKHAMKGLSYDNYDTGVIFGFLSQVVKLGEMFDSGKFVFAWDSESSLRRDMYPDYKAKRRRNKSEDDIALDNMAYPQFHRLEKTILPALGFRNIFSAKGYEADDIIASIVKGNNHNFVIASSDKDIWQLLRKNVMIHHPAAHKTITIESFISEYGFYPTLWPKVLALAGDSSDGIEGIPGVGLKRAVEYVRGNATPGAFWVARIQSPNGQAIVTRNMQLIKLPFSRVPSFNITWGPFNFQTFEEVCLEYGLFSFLKKVGFERWRKVFG